MSDAVEARREVARLVRALDAIPQAAVVSDATGRVLIRNRGAERLVGARHADALVAHAVDELLDQARRGIAGSHTLDLYGPPPQVLRIDGVPLDVDGRPDGAMVLIEDISEHRRTEAVRRDFVANVSHELRTPVGGIALLAETLAAEDDPEVTRRLAGRLQAEADRMKRIIEALLDLSRLEIADGGRRQPVPVHLLVDQAVDLVRPAARYHDVTVSVSPVPPDLAVLGDDSQLTSALHNLLDNAVKYSEAATDVEIRAERSGESVHLTVADHGIGIPSDDLERIFERFYRVDRARSRATGGTGLGLAIVRHVASNHGGDVVVASREGEGSTFTVRLPAAP
ncbi:MAG TPA: ATP-binding protein [Acidimicrobiales bacterium]|nr:ATP-binding protein [Acidimicrobiales bacterium]